MFLHNFLLIPICQELGLTWTDDNFSEKITFFSKKKKNPPRLADNAISESL